MIPARPLAGSVCHFCQARLLIAGQANARSTSSVSEGQRRLEANAPIRYVYHRRFRQTPSYKTPEHTPSHKTPEHALKRASKRDIGVETTEVDVPGLRIRKLVVTSKRADEGSVELPVAPLPIQAAYVAGRNPRTPKDEAPGIVGSESNSTTTSTEKDTKSSSPLWKAFGKAAERRKAAEEEEQRRLSIQDQELSEKQWAPAKTLERLEENDGTLLSSGTQGTSAADAHKKEAVVVISGSRQEDLAQTLEKTAIAPENPPMASSQDKNEVDMMENRMDIRNKEPVAVFTETAPTLSEDLMELIAEAKESPKEGLVEDPTENATLTLERATAVDREGDSADDADAKEAVVVVFTEMAAVPPQDELVKDLKDAVIEARQAREKGGRKRSSMKGRGKVLLSGGEGSKPMDEVQFPANNKAGKDSMPSLDNTAIDSDTSPSIVEDPALIDKELSLNITDTDGSFSLNEEPVGKPTENEREAAAKELAAQESPREVALSRTARSLFRRRHDASQSHTTEPFTPEELTEELDRLMDKKVDGGSSSGVMFARTMRIFDSSSNPRQVEEHDAQDKLKLDATPTGHTEDVLGSMEQSSNVAQANTSQDDSFDPDLMPKFYRDSDMSRTSTKFLLKWKLSKDGEQDSLELEKDTAPSTGPTDIQEASSSVGKDADGKASSQGRARTEESMPMDATPPSFDPNLFNSLFLSARGSKRSDLKPFVQQVKESAEAVGKAMAAVKITKHLRKDTRASLLRYKAMDTTDVAINNKLRQALRAGRFWDVFNLLHLIQKVDIRLASAIRHDFAGDLFTAALLPEMQCSPDQLVSLVKKLDDIDAAEPFIYIRTIHELVRVDRADLLGPIFERAARFTPEYHKVGLQESSSSESQVADIPRPQSDTKESLWIWVYIAFLLLRKRGYNSDFQTAFEKMLPHLRRPHVNVVDRMIEMRDPRYFPFTMQVALREELVDYAKEVSLEILVKNNTILENKLFRLSEIRLVKDAEELFKDIMTHPSLKELISENTFVPFLSMFTACRKEEMAETAWKMMVTSGHIPTTKSWNALLTGAVRCRNVEAMERVWQKILDNGVQPDGLCWSTRIYGLLQMKQIPTGIAALSEMAALGVKPTLRTVNGAIDGLTRHKYMDEALSVVREATKAGVVPDLITYNILLRGLLHARKMDHAISILLLMDKQGISPNVATFSMILDVFVKQSSRKIDISFVNDYLTAMEAVKEKPNVKTYTSLMHALLLQDREEDALKVSWGMKFQFTRMNSFSYTVWISYYARKGRFDELVALWSEILKFNIQQDHILYQVTIEGYAIYAPVSPTTGEPSWGTIKMMEYLKKMQDAGFSPSMGTYVGCLKRLIKEELPEMAWVVVQEAYERFHEDERSHASTRWSALEFWSVVEELRRYGWWDQTQGAISRNMAEVEDDLIRHV